MRFYEVVIDVAGQGHYATLELAQKRRNTLIERDGHAPNDVDIVQHDLIEEGEFAGRYIPLYL
jgi:hypothetical protein